MKWSYRIARVAGIGIFVHATFLFILIFVAWVAWNHEPTARSVLAALGGILALFACVVLHELGHALVARRFGIPTRDITLLPIGGVSRMERMPEEPGKELAISLAGPAVNVVIAGLLFLVVRGSWDWDFQGFLSGEAPFLQQLLVVNLLLAAFNLLPAFPMDGGRALRAGLTRFLGRLRATEVAGSIGQLVAIAFVVFGLGYSIILVLIGVFVFFGAMQETAHVRTRTALAGARVREATLFGLKSLRPSDVVGDVAAGLPHSLQRTFAVVDGDRVAGVVTATDVRKGISSYGDGARVELVMTPATRVVEEDEEIVEVMDAVREADAGALPVVRDGRLVGLLTTDSIGELSMVRRSSADPGGGSRGPRPGRVDHARAG